MIKAEVIMLEEVYKRLGYPPGIIPDAHTCEKVSEMAEQLLQTATPRVVKNEYMRSTLEPFLGGKDINRHLVHCDHCLLMAATLGSQVDTLIRKTSVNDMNEAVMMDAAASVMIESVAENVEAQVREAYLQQGRYITSRFSPGYGDFSIAVQNEFLQLLDAGRKIGLYATSSHILTPRKSITALCGISTQSVTGHLAGCDTCRLESVCQSRKEGKTCATKPI